MAIYYPQGIMTLRVVLEDFDDKSKVRLQKLHIFSVICRKLTVNLNSYKEADQFSADIDFKNFPFDPRSIRSAGVTIHIEDRKKLFRTDNRKNLIEPTAESTVFQGYVDTDQIRLSEDNRMVTLEGRDFTSLLIDREYLGQSVSTTKPIDLLLQDLLNQIEATKQDPTDSTRGLKVNNATNETLPTLASLNISLDSKAAKKNGRPRRTYWDMIQNIVADAGLIAYISLDELVISKPRVLYDDAKRKIFIYGANVKEMGFNIRVLSLNIETKEVIEARIPEEATDDWLQDIGLPKKAITIPVVRTDGSKAPKEDPAPFMTFRVRDIATKESLVTIGENVFEEVGRQQIEGRLTTKEMTVCEVDKVGQRPSLFDSTKFRIGTPIELTIDQGDLEGVPELFKIPDKGRRQNKIKRFLIQQCYQTEVAEAFAETLVNYDTPFYTKEIEFNLDQENGFTMEIGFINFIELPKNLAEKANG